MNKQILIIVFTLLQCFCIDQFAYSQSAPEYKEISLHINPSLGIGIPAGGFRQDVHNSSIYYGFDVSKTHNPALSFSIGAETPWFKNWFLIDSLWMGFNISTQRFKSKNTLINDHLWINTFYLTFSRYFSIHSYRPYARISLGASTMNTSQGAFVFSGGGAVNLGVFKNFNKHPIAIEIGYNAPLIAYKNKLTGFVCINLIYQFSTVLKIKEKEKFEPSFKY